MKPLIQPSARMRRSMRALLAVLAVAGAPFVPAHGSGGSDREAGRDDGAGATDAPPPILITDAMLDTARERVSEGDEPWRTAFEQVARNARQAREREADVTHGRKVHDVAKAARTDAGAARDAAFYAAVSGEAWGYATARRLILAWARAEPTPGAAFPWKPFAADVPRELRETAGGLHFGLTGARFAIAYGLVDERMTPAERADVERWFRQLAEWVRRGREAWIANDYAHRQRYNNHLSGQNLGQIALGLALGDEAMVEEAVDDPDNPRDALEMIDGAVLMPSRGPDQFWKHDARRVTRPGEIYDRYRVQTSYDGEHGWGLGYALLHLKLLALSAEMLHAVGDDRLWEHVGPHGQCLQVAFDHYAAFLTTPRDDWHPYHRDDRFPTQAIPLYEIAATRLPDSQAVRQVLRVNTDKRLEVKHSVLGHLPILLYGAPTWPAPEEENG